MVSKNKDSSHSPKTIYKSLIPFKMQKIMSIHSWGNSKSTKIIVLLLNVSLMVFDTWFWQTLINCMFHQFIINPCWKRKTPYLFRSMKNPGCNSHYRYIENDLPFLELSIAKLKKFINSIFIFFRQYLIFIHFNNDVC